MTAVSEAPELLLQHHLKKLRLPTVLREYEKLARQCAAENADHVRYLARLIELELIAADRPAGRSAKQNSLRVHLGVVDFEGIPNAHVHRAYRQLH